MDSHYQETQSYQENLIKREKFGPKEISQYHAMHNPKRLKPMS